MAGPGTGCVDDTGRLQSGASRHHLPASGEPFNGGYRCAQDNANARLAGRPQIGLMERCDINIHIARFPDTPIPTRIQAGDTVPELRTRPFFQHNA